MEQSCISNLVLNLDSPVLKPNLKNKQQTNFFILNLEFVLSINNQLHSL